MSAEPVIEYLDMWRTAVHEAGHVCAAIRLGRLEGGDRGRNLAMRASAELATEGVNDLESCLAMSTPGFARLT